jgi:tRNA(Ile)-lysidine synthase
MIKVQGKLDREVYVACSGGVDSMAVVDFLMRNHKVNLMFFDHQTENSTEALDFLTNKYYPSIATNTIQLIVGHIEREKERTESWEEYWRNERYRWFHSYEHPIITCHHLDDCVENWIFTSLHGEGRIIPYQNQNVIRPFRLNRKTEFTDWCRNKNVPWIEDSSNQDTRYMRNYIRHEIVPKALMVNPGLHKVIMKKVKDDGGSEDEN